MPATLFFEPVSGAVVEMGDRLFFFAVDTTTELVAYSDFDLTAPITQPVVADGNGRFPPIYLDSSGNDPRIVLEDVDGVEKFTVDRYPINDISLVEALANANANVITELTGSLETADQERTVLQQELDQAEERLGTLEGVASIGDTFGGTNADIVADGGFQRYPSGLVEIWGTTGDLINGQNEAVSFPITLDALFGVQVSQNRVSGDGGVETGAYVTASSVNGFTVEVGRVSGNSGGGEDTVQIYWSARGRIDPA